jgi:HEAT repeat protein
VREQTRDAMERARMALADAHLDRFEGFDRFDFDFQTPELMHFNSARSGEAAYTAGKDMLSARKYPEAIAQFDRVVAQKGANVDGALYWKAYAQFKLGKSDDAVATIAALRKDFAQSRYLADAKVLEADAKRRAGQPVNPASMDDDDLKLLAINGIKQTDPERAIPLLEGVLSSTNSLRVKKQALYVLASMPSQPKARQILLNYAKGAGNPDLQIEAIRYIAVGGSDKTAMATDLMQIYQGTQDTDVRMAVISALRGAGDRGNLWNIASSDKTPTALRGAAMRGAILGPNELWTLYEKETNKELKSQIVGLMGSMGATDQVMRVIKSDKDQDVVRRAIRSLGNQPAAKTGQLLVDLYGSEQDQQTRMTVINALGAQDNAEGLVAIARKEGSLPLKKEIVRELSGMASKSKVAADYLMEIIK